MQSALVIDVGNERISIPRFTVGDYVEWGAELDAAKRADMQGDLAAMPVKDRIEARLTFRIIPTDFTELAGLAFTPAGVKRIIDKCFSRAKVIVRDGQDLPEPQALPPDRAAAITSANTAGLPGLARLLAGVVVEQEPPKDEDQQKAEEPANPLPIGGKSS